MKTLFTAVTSVLLLSLFHQVHPSNPDSELVQNASASDVRHEQKRSASLGIVEVIHEKTTFVRIPERIDSISTRQVVNKPLPRSGYRIIGPVYSNGRRLPYQHRSLYSNNRVYNTEWYTDFEPNRESSRSPMNPPNNPSDSSFNRDITNGNEDTFNKKPLFHEAYYPRSWFLMDSSSSNGARTNGNEESDRHEQNVPTFLNGQLPRQNTLFNSSRVHNRNEGNTNFGPNRGKPQWTINPPSTSSDSAFNPDVINGNGGSFNKGPAYVSSDTYNPGEKKFPDRPDQEKTRLPINPPSTSSDSAFNRDVINGNGGSFNEGPVYVSSDTYNPGRENFPDRPDQGKPRLPINPPSTSSYSAFNRNVYNTNENPSTRGPGSDTFDAPKIVKNISPDANLYVGIINDFGFKLVETMNLKTNFILSPLSIFLALSMCYLGSNGTTKVQLEEAMGLKYNSVHGQTFHHGMNDLISSILLESSNYELYLANGLFFGKGFEYINKFKDDILKFYDGKVANLDFGNPQQSASEVDKWVSKITKNMIPKVSEGAPSLLTRLLVLNAIFFKGIWKTQFPPSMTFAGKFFSTDASEKTVPTMQLFNETFPFYRSQDHKTSFMKLPYEGDQVSLIIALPATIGENPMPNMRDDILCNVRYALNDTTMGTIALPKFGFDYKLSLIEPLKQLGISHLFDIDRANLDKMTHEKVAVSAFLHKAVIDINEQGTSASASTTLQLTFQTKKKDPDFIVNHPFAFYIVHEPTGVVLFNGKIFDIGQGRSEMLVNPRNPNIQRYPEYTYSGNIADLSKIRGG